MRRTRRNTALGTLQPTRLLIIGPPGAGKGTQSVRLSRVLDIAHVSTGDLLREAIRDFTPLGLAISECVAAGQMVPDVVVTELVQRRLEQPDARRRGFLLDGFPRNSDQLEQFVAWLAPAGLDAAIELSVAKDVAVERLATRSRLDDTIPGIRARFRAFEDETAAVLQRLELEGLLISVDADRPIADITNELLDALSAPRPRHLAVVRP